VLKHRTLIVTSATSDEKFDNKEQDRKVYFSERDAVVKHSLRPHQKWTIENAGTFWRFLFK